MNFSTVSRLFLSRRVIAEQKLKKVAEENQDLVIIAIDPHTGLSLSSYKGTWVIGEMDKKIVLEVLKYSRFKENVMGFLDLIGRALNFQYDKVPKKLKIVTDVFFITVGRLFGKMTAIRQEVKKLNK